MGSVERVFMCNKMSASRFWISTETFMEEKESLNCWAWT